MPTTIQCRYCYQELPVSNPDKVNTIRGSHERWCTSNPDRQLSQAEQEATWAARVANGETIPVTELSGFEETRTRLHCVLAALQETGGHISDRPQGRATAKLVALLPFECSTHSINDYLLRLERGGWIAREKNAKRTFNIGLRQMYHPDTTPASVAAADLRATASETYVGGQAVAATVPATQDAPGGVSAQPDEVLRTSGGTVLTDERIQELADEAEAGYDVSHLVERQRQEQELFGNERPGRWAARLERSLPELVRTTVNTELTAMAAEMLERLGFRRQAMTPEEIEALQAESAHMVAEIARLRSQIERHVEDSRRQQAMIDWLSDREDETLRGTNEGQQATRQGLTVSQLPDAFRRTGAHAIEHGWAIHRTRGRAGHLLWRSPTGQTCFSPSTPSNDFTANQILWRKLRRLGLEDFRGRTQESADSGRWSGDHQGE